MDRRLDRKTLGAPRRRSTNWSGSSARPSAARGGRTRGSTTHLGVAARPRSRHADARLPHRRRVPARRRADRGRSDRPYPRRGYRGRSSGSTTPPDPIRSRPHGVLFAEIETAGGRPFMTYLAAVHGTPRIGPAPAGRPVRRSVGEGPIGDGRGVGSDRGLSRDLGSVPASTDDETVPSD